MSFDGFRDAVREMERLSDEGKLTRERWERLKARARTHANEIGHPEFIEAVFVFEPPKE